MKLLVILFMILINVLADLGSLEATKLANANTIKDLKVELEELKHRCMELESERRNLGRKLSANSSEAHVQIRALQRVGWCYHIVYHFLHQS